MPTNFLDWATAIDKVFETLFFIVAGLVTFFTYLKAKETILQPMKTEIFKKQLDELSNVLKLFVGVDEISLRNQFSFEKLTTGNFLALYDDYGKHFFDLKIKEEDRFYNKKDFPCGYFNGEDLSIRDSYIDGMPKDNNVKIIDNRVRAVLWGKYKYAGIRIPKEYLDTMDKFTSVLESPLLPKKCAKLIEEYIRIVRKNATLINKIINDHTQEFPEKYPSIEDLQKSKIDWLNNKYNEEFIPLKPKANEIVDFIRGYWMSDKIISDK